jgi:hypothetical protein
MRAVVYDAPRRRPLLCVNLKGMGPTGQCAHCRCHIRAITIWLRPSGAGIAWH